jgi:hypothetical protein
MARFQKEVCSGREPNRNSGSEHGSPSRPGLPEGAMRSTIDVSPKLTDLKSLSASKKLEGEALDVALGRPSEPLL